MKLLCRHKAWENTMFVSGTIHYAFFFLFELPFYPLNMGLDYDLRL